MSKPVIYTSYFANLRNVPSSIEPIAISLFVPNFYNGKRAIDLAPSKEILNSYKAGEINESEYKKMYLDLLESRIVSIEDWLSYFEQHSVVLVCYEGKDKFCHRHILGELLEGLGFEVMEI